MTAPEWWRIGLEGPAEDEERLIAAFSQIGLDALEIAPTAEVNRVRVFAYVTPEERDEVERALDAVEGATRIEATPVFRDSWAGAPVSVPYQGGEIFIEQGSAFGEGEHPTTRTAIEILERTIAGGETVLDVGSGTGVLGLVAIRLGAIAVDAIDVAEAARRATRSNALLDGESRLVVLEGGIDGIDKSYDVVVANILAPTLIALAPDLKRVSKKRIVLSGVLADDVARVTASFLGWELVDRQDEEGWSALALAKR